MPASARDARLRQTVLAACVLDDIDLEPMDEGVEVKGVKNCYLTWDDVAHAVGSHSPESELARSRVSMLLTLHKWVASNPNRAAHDLRLAATLLAMPVDHVWHGGDDWTQDRVLGGALQVGVGVSADLLGGELATPLPSSVASAAGLDPAELFATVQVKARGTASQAARRIYRNRPVAQWITSASDAQAVLRPSGGLDVPSLLATAEVRAALAETDGSGMRAIAVPSRRRGWYDLSRIDPAFVQAAWIATEEVERGLPRSLLVTADEVVLAPAADGVIRLSLEDPAKEGHQFHRPVFYR